MHRSLLPALALLVLARPSRAAQPHASVSLSYLPGEQGARCPSEEFFRMQLAGRFGYDPFDEPTPRRHLTVTVTRHGNKYEVRGEIIDDGDGKVSFKYQAPAALVCKEAVAVMGFAVAAELTQLPAPEPAPQPEVIVVEAPPPSPFPSSPPPPPLGPSMLPAKPAPPALLPPPAPRPRVQLAAASFLAINSTPSPTAGFMLSLGARWPAFSLAVEGHVLVPRPLDVTLAAGRAATVETMLLALAGVPCAHLGYFLGCGLVEVGQHQVRVRDLESTADASALYVAAGVRAGVELPLANRFALRGYGDLLVVRETDVVVKPQTVWAPVPLAGALAFAATASF